MREPRSGSEQATISNWFCRKKSIDPRTGDCWTQLCCKRRKLLKAGGPVGGDLPFADHVGSLDP